MKGPFSIRTLIRVSTKVIPLGLQQIRWEPSQSIAVIVGQGGGEGWSGQAEMRRCHDHRSPRSLGLLDGVLEVGIEQQVFEIRLFIEGFLDAIEELSANDTAAAP